MSLAEQAQMLSVKALTRGVRQDLGALGHKYLTVKEGEMVALVGTNGSGKSSLFCELSAGLVPVREGKIYFRGEEITGYRA